MMWRCLFLVVIAGGICITATGVALAEKRVALVIGNSAYTHAPELTNPRNDAIDMAAVLRGVGIEVIEGIDLDKVELEKKIRKFSAALQGAEVGVFFYAGHGLQVSGSNYIVPVDAELSTVAALEFEMVRLDAVQRLMENAAKTNILFLDACRNNPLSRNLARAIGARAASIGHGLAPAESGVGTLISFSTQPGNVALDGAGRNSPFAGPLLKAVAMPGEDVMSILTRVRNIVLKETGGQQIPWENHALLAKFYFNPEASTAARVDQQSREREVAAPKPGESFRDCPDCPELVVLPPGSFAMGSPENETGRNSSEGPLRTVTIAKAFAVAKFEATFDDWTACVTGGGCKSNKAPSDHGWGKARRPVIDVSWNDAKEYVTWLASKTGKLYRLLTEAEWEYAARAGTTTRFAFGSRVTKSQAQYADESGARAIVESDDDDFLRELMTYRAAHEKSVEVGAFMPNGFGLYDMHGNVWEWVEDCWHESYNGAPSDGSAWTTGCEQSNIRVRRGGSWLNFPRALRSANRIGTSNYRGSDLGFRVARSLF